MAPSALERSKNIEKWDEMWDGREIFVSQNLSHLQTKKKIF